MFLRHILSAPIGYSDLNPRHDVPPFGYISSISSNLGNSDLKIRPYFRKNSDQCRSLEPIIFYHFPTKDNWYHLVTTLMESMSNEHCINFSSYLQRWGRMPVEELETCWPDTRIGPGLWAWHHWWPAPSLGAGGIRSSPEIASPWCTCTCRRLSS